MQKTNKYVEPDRPKKAYTDFSFIGKVCLIFFLNSFLRDDKEKKIVKKKTRNDIKKITKSKKKKKKSTEIFALPAHVTRLRRPCLKFVLSLSTVVSEWVDVFIFYLLKENW